MSKAQRKYAVETGIMCSGIDKQKAILEVKIGVEKLTSSDQEDLLDHSP